MKICILLLILISAGMSRADEGDLLYHYRFLPSQRYMVPADSSFYPMTLTHPYPTYLKMKNDSVKTALFVDFRKKEVELVRYYGSRLSLSAVSHEDSTVPGVALSSYVFHELNEYMDYVNSLQFREDWKTGSPFFNLVEKKREAFNILDIQIPVKMPAWARRVVGSEGPRLTISGRFKLIVGGASHWQKGVNIENQKQGWPDISVNQEMAFTVTGKIGRLINVSLSTDNTQDVTDQLKKQMKIHYKGETEDELEDEIIQEIEAGYTNFAMPGAEFDGYSESHEGLFGIKVRMKLGDLNLTTIISQEDGQTQSNKFNPRQNETTTPINDNEIAFGRIFFLDSNYYNYYYKDYFKRTGLTQPSKIKKIYLLKYVPGFSQTQFDQDPTQYSNYRNVGLGFHRILKRVDSEGSSDFELDEVNGTVVLSAQNSLNSAEDQLLAYFEREDGTSSFDLGLTYVYDTLEGPDTVTVDGEKVHPYLLRPENFRNDMPQWKLMWKNVYDLGMISSENQNSIKIAVAYEHQNTWLEKMPINGRDSVLSDFFGLTKSGKPEISNTRVFMFDYGLVALPPQFGPTPFNDSTLIPDTMRKNDKIYLYTKEEQQGITNMYRINITAVAAKTTFSLGVINILEGTEVVRSGSRPLVRDVDYLIQYDVGQITLISDEAIRSMNEITVEYEYAPFFVPESKTFMGVQAEYKLPGIGKDSKIAASFLRKSETSQDKRAQLGREPTTNMLFDVNTKLNFEPGWMTDAVNRIPLIKTGEKSALSFSAEYARSIVDPNRNDRKEALIDDFEDAKTLYSMQLSDATWRWPSPPAAGIIGRFDSLQCWGGNERGEGKPLPDVGWFAWYTRDTTQVKIWPGSANNQARWRFLEIQMEPHKRKRGEEGLSAAEEWFRKGSWGGIMAPLGLGVKNQLTNAQFLEIVVYVDDIREKGRLHIDLGRISEDLRISAQNPATADTSAVIIMNAAPDRLFNNEWWQGNTSMTTNNDLGLDMRRDALEWFFAPVQCSSGICFETISVNTPGVTDPAGDNYDWTVGSTEFRSFNGTQGNATGDHADTRKQYSPDNEDVFTMNGQVDRRDAYFHYWIDLNTTDKTLEPYYETSTETGWRLYRIPLNQRKMTGDPVRDAIPDKYGAPLLSEATGIRVWMDNLTDRTRLQIAKMEIVGNKWISRDTGLVVRDSAGTVLETSGKKFNVSVVNTVDNPEYVHPAFVPQFYDEERDVKIKEQSLLLEYDSLSRADPEVQAVYFTQLPMDFRLYRRLVLYYYPVKRPGRADPGRPVYFFFRFGSDSLNYYEVHLFPDQAGSWDSLRLDLNEIALLKKMEQERLGGAGNLNVTQGGLSVVGLPTFAQVKWMSLGFRVDTAAVASAADAYSGGYWVNDLKLIEPEELGGNAARVNLTTRFADFFDFSTAAYYRDGSFLKLTEKQQGGGESEFSTDVNSSMRLSKFTPSKWGLDIPLTGTLRTSVRRPRFFPNSDVKLSDDGLLEMAPSALNLLAGADVLSVDKTLSKRYESTTVSKSVTSSYKKNTASDRLLLNLTADRISTSAGYSVTDANDMSKSRKDYAINNSVNYRASLEKETAVTPFANTQGVFMRNHFSDMKVHYYPRTLDFKVYDARYTRSSEWSRYYQATDAPLRTLSTAYALAMSHSYDMNMPLLEWKHLNLGFTHNNSVERNLGEAVTRNQGLDWGTLGEYVVAYDHGYELRKGLGVLPTKYILYGETSNNQSFTYYFEPKLADWLTHDFDYSSGYNHSVNIQKIGGADARYLNLGLKTAFSTDVSWMFVDMFSKGAGLISGGKESAAFKKVKAAFDYLNFNRVGFNYGVDVDRKVSNLTDLPLSPGGFLAFKSGFYGQTPASIFTGDDDEGLFGGWKYADSPESRDYFVEGLGASQSDMRSVRKNASSSIGVTLPFLLNMSVNSSLRYGQSYTEIVKQTTVDTTYSWPDVTLSGSLPDLMRVWRLAPFLADRLNRSSANSTFNYMRTLGVKYQQNNASVRWEDYSYRYSFSPLLHLDMEFKNSVRLSNDFNWSLERKFNTEKKTPNEGTEDYKLSDKIGINYTIQKNRTLKLVFWEMTLNNQLSLFANYTYTMNWSYKWDVENGEFKTFDEYAEARNEKEGGKDFKKARTKDVGAGAEYNITNKMKAGGEFGWAKSANDIPFSGDEDSEDVKLDYNIKINLWVEWTF